MARNMITSGRSRWCTNTSEGPTDSGQNSLEYWDYSMELEMLQGPQDLQLAAELGKTLLERNRDLESSLRQQQHVIDDQSHEIEYLTKQTAALREVNDSRLRIYEQLEISIADLEKSNQRLASENNADKKRIRSLCDSIDLLETRCDELGGALEEAQERSRRAQQQRRWSRPSEGASPTLRRVMSVEGGLQDMNNEQQLELDELREEIAAVRNEKNLQLRRIRDLNTEITCLVQENELLQDQLSSFKRKEEQSQSWEQELQSLQRLCRRCSHELGSGESLAESPLGNPPQEKVPRLMLEEEDESVPPPHQSCALIKLHNGGYAWGSQESLASIGQVVGAKREEPDERFNDSCKSKPDSCPDGQQDSLLSELDAQYRVLIQKYEALLEAQQAVVERAAGKSVSLKEDGSPSRRSPQEDLSDSGSSGFLEEPHHLNKEIQTHVSLSVDDDDSIPAAFRRNVDEDSSPPSFCMNKDPTENHFNKVPKYKKLFQEIFAVLNKSVDYDAPLTEPIEATITSQSRKTPPSERDHQELPELHSKSDIQSVNSESKTQNSETMTSFPTQTESSSSIKINGEIKCTSVGVQVSELPSDSDCSNYQQSCENVVETKCHCSRLTDSEPDLNARHPLSTSQPSNIGLLGPSSIQTPKVRPFDPHASGLSRSVSLDFQNDKPPPVPPTRQRLRLSLPQPAIDPPLPIPAYRQRNKRQHSHRSYLLSPSEEIPKVEDYPSYSTMAIKTSPLAEIAKLKKLEKSYAEALASGIRNTKQKLKQRCSFKL